MAGDSGRPSSVPARAVARTIELDVERSTPDESRRGIAPLVAANERSREREAVERLAAGLGQGGNGAAGLDEVVTALNEHRVALLMLGRDARLSGATCPRCGWLSASTGSCPVDGSALEASDAIAERVAQAALRDGVDVLVMRQDGAELMKRGAIGALLWY